MQGSATVGSDLFVELERNAIEHVDSHAHSATVGNRPNVPSGGIADLPINLTSTHGEP